MIGYNDVRGKKGGVSFAAVLQYEVDGKQLTSVATISSSSPPWQVGDHVRVWYHKDNPSSILMDNQRIEYLVPAFLIAIGIVSLVSGLRARRKQPSATS